MPLLRHHDRSLFDFYLYASVARPDAVTDEYRAWAGDNFRDIRRMDDVSAAELVRRDRIDILVDLAVHGAGHRLRLFACKPAPIQMTWLGYAGTTGLDSIDYRLTDPFLDPPGTDLGVYTESSLHLPESFWCYDALEADLPVRPLPALAAGFITFGCLGSPRKVHPGVVSLWARVLGAVPGSRLLLVAEEHARESMRRAFASAGIEADRIEFTGRVRRREYLEHYHRIDVGLDTFPFAGGHDQPRRHLDGRTGRHPERRDRAAPGRRLDRHEPGAAGAGRGLARPVRLRGDASWPATSND